MQVCAQAKSKSKSQLGDEADLGLWQMQGCKNWMCNLPKSFLQGQARGMWGTEEDHEVHVHEEEHEVHGHED
jgi:hypothetical protein